MLADRGLVGAVCALALDLAVPVSVVGGIPGQPPPPVESAACLAVSECLASVVNHSGAGRAEVDPGYRDGVLSVVVSDDGDGGASMTAGTGLCGVARRIGAFDGTIALASPAGGPTVVRMEVLRVVIAEDLTLLRDGLARILRAHDIEVVAAVGDPVALAAVLEEEHPDVAIVDVRMPPTFTNQGLVAAIDARGRRQACPSWSSASTASRCTRASSCSPARRRRLPPEGPRRRRRHVRRCGSHNGRRSTRCSTRLK